jgi:hypothetical protein
MTVVACDCWLRPQLNDSYYVVTNFALPSWQVVVGGAYWVARLRQRQHKDRAH